MAEAWQCGTAIEAADKALAAQQWVEAKDHLDTAIAHTESAPDLLLKRARCYFELGDFYGAAADTGRVIKVSSRRETGRWFRS